MSKTKKEEDRERQQAAESETIGSYLKRLRSEKGLSVEEVSSSTRISATNVRAIEGLEFDKLPADAFTRGQLNIYADFLGIDPAYLVSQFMKERDESLAAGRRAGPRHNQRVLAPKTMAEPSRISSAAVAGFLLLLIVILFTAFCLYTSWSPFNFLRKETAIIGVFPGNRAAPPQQDQAGGKKRPATPATAPKKSPATAPKSQNEATPAGATTKIPTARYSLTVLFSKNTGVAVTRDGGATLSMFFKSGARQTWKAGKSLKLVFARPGSATLLLNGKALAFPAFRNGRPTLLIPEDLPDHR
ncbi:MAG: helix-turn-helix domain-containing protein [Deltaproteobacteria bacterium]|nr:helix-turn-helix domain-containing protein [Deltaproteobacteria bacterium]